MTIRADGLVVMLAAIVGLVTGNRMNHLISGIFLIASATAVLAATQSTLAIIPVPQKLEIRDGVFQLTPRTLINTDSAGHATGEYLAERLHKSTGYPFQASTKAFVTAPVNTILLTTQNASTNLGAEGYELTVTSDSVVVRAPTQTGLFYGVQSLLQLFPSEIFSASRVSGVEWRIPAVHIEPRSVKKAISYQYFLSV